MDNKNILAEAFRRHGDLIQKSADSLLTDVLRGATMLIETVKNGKKVLICGNGGSAADSQHFAAEWTCKYKNDRSPLPAMALTVDTSALTAIGNDYGFEDVFYRQIKAIGQAGDLLVAITTSGQSKNILKAMRAAREKNIKIIALTGERGMNLVGTADLVIAVPSSETARIQEVHELIYHAWCECADANIQSS